MIRGRIRAARPPTSASPDTRAASASVARAANGIAGRRPGRTFSAVTRGWAAPRGRGAVGRASATSGRGSPTVGASRVECLCRRAVPCDDSASAGASTACASVSAAHDRPALTGAGADAGAAVHSESARSRTSGVSTTASPGVSAALPAAAIGAGGAGAATGAGSAGRASGAGGAGGGVGAAEAGCSLGAGWAAAGAATGAGSAGGSAAGSSRRAGRSVAGST